MADKLHAAGYHVLMFDHRGHGGSGGQVTAFGAAEAADVVGALDFLEAAGVDDIVGLAPSMGAAAMVDAAAGDDRLAALILVGTYDDLGGMAGDATGKIFTPPLDHLARRLALPAASAHAGVHLAGFRPIDAVRELWPRPVMVLHAADDTIIPQSRGRRLYNAADAPKLQWWLDAGGHNGVLEDDEAWREILLFLEGAVAVPNV